MFSEDQRRRLSRTSNLQSKLLILCLQPNLNLFEAFVSAFYSARRSSSPSKRERLLARRELYLSILGNESNVINKVRNTSRLKDEETSHTYREFASYLHRWSARWNAASIDEIISLVVLLDRDLVGSVSESTILNFCVSLDEDFANDRTNPHRVVQTMLIKMIDKAHLSVAMSSFDADLKTVFQHFIFDATHKTKPKFTILHKYCSFLEVGCDLTNDSIIQFWEEQFYLVRQLTTMVSSGTSDNGRSFAADDKPSNDETLDKTGASAGLENNASQSTSVVDALKIKLEVFGKQFLTSRCVRLHSVI